MTTLATASSAPARVHLPAPRRLGALLAVLAFPFWIGCFILLYGSQGPRPETTPTLAELHESYLAAAGLMWAFGLLSIAATLALVAAPAVIAVAILRATARRTLPILILVTAAVAGALELFVAVSIPVFLASDPEHLPGWVVGTMEGSDGNDLINIVGWTLATLAVVLLGFATWQAGALPRAGLIVGIIGGVALIAIVALQVQQPMAAAVLLLVLGIALLRR